MVAANEEPQGDIPPMIQALLDAMAAKGGTGFAVKISDLVTIGDLPDDLPPELAKKIEALQWIAEAAEADAKVLMQKVDDLLASEGVSQSLAMASLAGLLYTNLAGRDNPMIQEMAELLQVVASYCISAAIAAKAREAGFDPGEFKPSGGSM